MTGFGRGTAVAGDRQVSVELRAVNHRFLEIKVRGAAAPALEDLCVARVRERLERGAVTVVVAVERGGGGGGPRVDGALARRVFADLAALAGELGLPPPTLADVVRVPGVITVDDGAAAELAGPLGAALDRIGAGRGGLGGHAGPR